MIFSAADQTALIAALGESVTLAGTSVVADFRREGNPVNGFDGSVICSAPTLRIPAALRATLEVGYGTPVIAGAAAYQVAEIIEEQSGLVLLILTRDPDSDDSSSQLGDGDIALFDDATFVEDP